MVEQYKIVIMKSALKDKDKIKTIPRKNVDKLLEILKSNPYQNPPSHEKLTGNLKELYSRRINHKHRLVYKVSEEQKTVVIISMWSHYEF